MSKNFKHNLSNFSHKSGEIDLIVKKENILYFVEVKTISGSFNRDNLIERIHPKKINRLKKAIHIYLAKHSSLSNQSWRLSGVLIAIDKQSKTAELEFIENLY